jgi:RNA polymerase sigma factor (TIGR02999 family)
MESTIASLIEEVEGGESSASRDLFSTLYGELRRMAARELARHGGPSSVGATTLLHETYIDMASREGTSFPTRGKFMKYASRVMRGLIVDQSRSRQALKRGGQFRLTTLDTQVASAVDEGETARLAQISEALDDLAKLDPDLAQVVDLHFFCGFSFAETASLLGFSKRTTERKWEKARILLHRAIRTGAAPI